MANVIKAEIMKNHCVPVLILQLPSNVSSNVLVDLSEILLNPCKCSTSAG